MVLLNLIKLPPMSILRSIYRSLSIYLFFSYLSINLPNIVPCWRKKQQTYEGNLIRHCHTLPSWSRYAQFGQCGGCSPQSLSQEKESKRCSSFCDLSETLWRPYLSAFGNWPHVTFLCVQRHLVVYNVVDTCRFHQSSVFCQQQITLTSNVWGLK